MALIPAQWGWGSVESTVEEDIFGIDGEDPLGQNSPSNDEEERSTHDPGPSGDFHVADTQEGKSNGGDAFETLLNLYATQTRPLTGGVGGERGEESMEPLDPVRRDGQCEASNIDDSGLVGLDGSDLFDDLFDSGDPETTDNVQNPGITNYVQPTQTTDDSWRAGPVIRAQEEESDIGGIDNNDPIRDYFRDRDRDFDAWRFPDPNGGIPNIGDPYCAAVRLYKQACEDDQELEEIRKLIVGHQLERFRIAEMMHMFVRICEKKGYIKYVDNVEVSGKFEPYANRFIGQRRGFTVVRDFHLIFTHTLLYIAGVEKWDPVGFANGKNLKIRDAEGNSSDTARRGLRDRTNPAFVPQKISDRWEKYFRGQKSFFLVLGGPRK